MPARSEGRSVTDFSLCDLLVDLALGAVCDTPCKSEVDGRWLSEVEESDLSVA